MPKTLNRRLTRLATAAALVATSLAAQGGPLDGASLVWTQKHASAPAGFWGSRSSAWSACRPAR